jgi:Xaa-Pro dipeptidase
VSLVDSAVPAVIAATAAQNMPALPTSKESWIKLHGDHVQRLVTAYGAVMSRLGLDGIVIHSGIARKKYAHDDQYWPSALTPHFQHWTPYRETPALLVFFPGQTPKIIVEEHQSYWEGPAPANESWDQSAFVWERVSDLEKIKGLSSCVFIGDDQGLATALGIAVENRDRADVLANLDQLRTLKSPYEVAAIRQATTIAAKGHNSLREHFLSDAPVSELALHQLYLAETAATDFDIPYGNIVALGANCGILHHVHYDRAARSGDLSLLVDAGALHHGYASDITRTWCRGSDVPARIFKGLIDAVDSAQLDLVGMFTVGQEYEELHNHAHSLLADILRESGLVRMGREELVAGGVTRLFFPHGLGHSLGLQVHDVGMRLKNPALENPYLRNTSKITAGQVCTIEPGLYFIPTLMKRLVEGHARSAVDTKMLDALMPFGGIRIEDNILATDSGPVNLTRDLI